MDDDSTTLERRAARDGAMPAAGVDVEVVEHPSATLRKLRELFRQSTGLDLFLLFRAEPLGRWKEEALAGRVALPRFCQVLRSNPRGQARCLASHQTMMRAATACSRPICLRCHAGLTTLHLPVAVADKGAGDIQTVCALRQEDRDRAARRLRSASADLGLPRRELGEAFEELAVMSRAQTEYAAQWLEAVGGYLAEASAARSPDGAGDRPRVEAPPDCPPIEQRIRLEIGRAVPLPAWRAQRSTGGGPALVERVLAFVEQHHQLPLSTQVMAQALGFDASYFSRIVKQHARESLTERLRRVRLRHAQRLLQDPFLSVLEVAARAGFADASYFTRVFRDAFGMTPSQFRELALRAS